MQVLEALKELMVASNSYQEPTLEEIDRWSKIFNYSVSEAPGIITQFRADINRQRLTDVQWYIIKDDKEAEGYGRETYEHWLQVWSNKSKISNQPRASDDKAFVVFKLQAPFPDIESLQSKVGISATLKKGLGEEGDADFAFVTGAAKRAIGDWIETQLPRPPRPTFIRLSLSPKDLLGNSSDPTLGVDSSLPQHRLQDNQCHASAQMEYLVWYLFYGTLMDPQTVQKCVSLPSTPRLVPASTKGGILRSWGRKYKALVDGPADARVDGSAYLVEIAEHEEYLRFRETEAYEVVPCRINLEGGEEIQGLTFRFVKQEDLDVD
ncbi:MAG: hypothetical protein L6R38_001202 [Xanthoria sp. 2 TBL-2021]|nr:MAG: hypothetical protein L6R38_001202 [Xanthoria sp. 2 TBL-2021]